MESNRANISDLGTVDSAGAKLACTVTSKPDSISKASSLLSAHGRPLPWMLVVILVILVAAVLEITIQLGDKYRALKAELKNLPSMAARPEEENKSNESRARLAERHRQ